MLTNTEPDTSSYTEATNALSSGQGYSYDANAGPLNIGLDTTSDSSTTGVHIGGGLGLGGSRYSISKGATKTVESDVYKLDPKTGRIKYIYGFESTLDNE